MTKNKFDVVHVPLKGSNLIEASAGTGKTYSIAILVIRLIVEERIKLKEILMVTFTKAAVAELEVRIRKFIREAYSYVNQNAKIDDTLKAIIDNGIANIGINEVLNLLNKARKQLDETSIYTIHGFCQKTLTSFAFETGQTFNSEVIEDEAPFINAATSDYWREKITTLDTDLLIFLLENGLSKDQMSLVVSKAKRGKTFIYKKTQTIADYWQSKEKKEDQLSQLISAFNTVFKDSRAETMASIGTSGHAFNTFASLIDDPEGFRLKLIEKRTAKYVSTKLHTLLELAEDVEDAAEALKKLANDAIDYLYGEAIAYCENLIELQKQEQSLFSFDDLINKLHQTRSSEALNLALRKQYKAVFIDEFQDTDQKQYELFDTFFNDASIVFYIGDPKQSIYSFKGTDIDTYLEATQKVDQSYTMSQNYRSTAAYISAMNTFFTSNDNPFYDERIAYEVVSAGIDRPEIKLKDDICDPLSLYECKSQKEIINQTVNQVKELLMGKYYIGERRVQPSDIGILVRANAKGKEIKEGLNKFRIPAITIDDSRVLDSEQSTLLLYLLKAIYEPNTHTINRVLLSCLSSKTKDDLLTYDREVDIEFFKIIHKMWVEKGIFSAINAFMDRYHTLDHIHSSKVSDAERISSNILQINEILHKKENQSKSSPKDLIHWLETAIAGAEESGDYTQRLENDEDAVKIVTIHKSKGLAYNIVIAPYLDMKSSHDSKWPFIEYKDPESRSYCFASQVTDEAETLYSEQAERENRRLIYVALTRAAYMGIIIHSSYQAKANRGIKTFIDGVLVKENWHFKPLLESDNRRYNETKTEIDQSPRQASAVPIESTWSNYSFSALSEYTPHTMPAVTSSPEGYDHFIFDTFPKGALAGNFLHFLFENIDFGSQDFSAGMNKALKRYQSVFPAGDDLLEQQLSTMLKHVLEAIIPTENSFTLSQIQADLKLPEVAFDFQMQSFATQQLHALIPHLDLAREGDIQGMMSGFIDLLFEHEGKFYLLDWKSNYLGNKVENYTEDLLEEAMHQSNYHLQYYIYTVATKLYLQNCIPDFDYQTHFGGVIYIYARGCRQNKSTGVYFTRPEEKGIKDLEALLVG